MGKIKHGLWKTKLFRRWGYIMERCTSPKHKSYKDYGGRGITICEEWKEFLSFYNWAMNNGYEDNLTIDRIDVNKGYNPSNCRWITMQEQQKNKRNNHNLMINGETKLITEWAREYGIHHQTIIHRIKTGVTGMDLLRPGRKSV